MPAQYYCYLPSGIQPLVCLNVGSSKDRLLHLRASYARGHSHTRDDTYLARMPEAQHHLHWLRH